MRASRLPSSSPRVGGLTRARARLKHASTLLTTGGEVTRVWHVDASTVVTLHHFPLTDERAVAVNGVQVPTERFTLRDGRTCEVRVTPTSGWLASRAGIGYSYACECASLGGDGGGAPVRVRENTERASLDPPLSSAEEADVVVDERVVVSGDGVAWYRLVRASSPPFPAVDVHRRFRDFHIAYSQVVSAFRGTHFYSSVPALPPKETPLFSTRTHLDPAFLAERRAGLQAWIRKLLALPGVAGALNPDVQEFLGLGGPPGVHETSVVFDASRLGIRLQRPAPPAGGGPTSFCAQVVDVVAGEASPAVVAMAQQGKVRVGDMITRVAGDSALLATYDSVLAMLRQAPRPVVVHLLGVREEAGGAPAKLA